jgi:hypothetical protein
MKFNGVPFILFERRVLFLLVNRGYTDSLITIDVGYCKRGGLEKIRTLLRTDCVARRLYYYFKSLTGWAKVAGLCYPGELQKNPPLPSRVGRKAECLPTRVRRGTRGSNAMRPLSSRAHKSGTVQVDNNGVAACPTVDQESQSESAAAQVHIHCSNIYVRERGRVNANTHFQLYMFAGGVARAT